MLSRKLPRSLMFVGGLRALLFFSVILVAASSSTLRAATAADFVFGTLPKQGAEPTDRPYRLLIPPNYNAAKKYPLILFLHGSGERGTNNTSQIDLNANTVLQLVSTANQRTYPCFMLIPQTDNTAGNWDATVLGQVVRLIGQLQSTYSIDANRIYVTGLSMGGAGTMSMIRRYPFMFAATIILAGWDNQAYNTNPQFYSTLYGSTNYEYLATLPMWLIHAANDPSVLIGGSDTFVNGTRGVGARVIYTRYDSGEHHIMEIGYSHPGLLPWLMAQRRNQPPAGAPSVSITSPASRFVSQTGLWSMDASGSAAITGGVSKVNWTFAPSIGQYGVDTSTYALAGGTNSWSAFGAQLLSSLSTQLLVVGTGPSMASLGGVTTVNDSRWTVPPLVNINPPVVAVTSPTSSGVYVTSGYSLNLSGTATGVNAKTIKNLTWKNDRGGEGGCVGTGYGTANFSWSIQNIDLQPGQNVITLTARDSNSVAGSTTLLVQAGAEFSDAQTSTDVGTAGLAGSTQYNAADDTITVSGAGSDIAVLRDSGRFSSVAQSGDFEVFTRIDSFSANNAGAKAGLMIRESVTDTSGHASLVVSPDGTLSFLRRTRTGLATTVTTTSSVSLPLWLKLSRRADVISAYYSTDAVTWSSLGVAEMSIATAVRAGLVVCSKNTAELAVAKFTSPEFNTLLPVRNFAGLDLQDVGVSKTAATCSYDAAADRISLSATGVFPGTAREGIAFLSMRSNGDGAFLTYVSPSSGGQAAQRAGVMMRDSLNDNAPQVTLAIAGTGLVVLESRASSGGNVVTRFFADSGRYLILDRRGDVFTAYISNDKSTWRTLGTVTVYMRTQSHVGLVAISKSQTVPATVQFLPLSVGL